MKRYNLSMPDSEAAIFENLALENSMSKSAFLRILLANYQNNIPDFIENKEAIKLESDIITLLKSFLLQNKVSDSDKMYLYEKLNTLENLFKKA